MDGVRKLIEKLDMVPEGKELSLRQKITLVLWGIAVFLIPFLYIPYFIFQKLSLYPLVLIAFINIDKWWKLCWGNKLLRWIAFAIIAFIGWQAVSLPFAVKLSEITIDDNVKPLINNAIVYGSWYVFLATAFMFPREKLEKTFCCSFTAILLCCACYSVIEIMHFCNVQWATDFLSKSIHYLMVVENNGWWWPPVFWDQPRLRSVFPEPSYFAIMLVFSTLYYSARTLYLSNKKKNAISLILMVLSAILLALTKSAGGALALSAATAFFIVLSLIFFRKLTVSERIKSGILSVLLVTASLFAMGCQRGGFAEFTVMKKSLNQPVTVIKIPKTEKKVVEEKKRKKVKTPKVKRLHGSSSTRIIHLKTELREISERPLLGAGYGEYSDTMCEALKESTVETPESRSWWMRQNTPRLNAYTAAMVEFGIPGGVLFLSIIFLPAMCMWITSIRKQNFTTAITMGAVYCGLMTILNFANAVIMIYLMLFVLPLFMMANTGKEDS